jgi:hypothetical protein
MPSNHLQIRTLTGVITEIPALPQRMKNFFARPDAATMEEAITRFMDGMEAQERCGFNFFRGPAWFAWAPTSANCQGKSSNDTQRRWKVVLSSPCHSMTEEKQKGFTPSKLLLYKHALEYRYRLV